MQQDSSKASDKDLEIIIGNTLRWGVWLSFFVTIFGLLLSFFQTGKTAPLLSKPPKFSFQTLWQGLLQFDPYQIMMLGILILVLTPLLRVVFGLLGYIKEKNRLYVVITLLVLLIIGISMLLGAKH